MNYREQQLRAIIKKDYVPKSLHRQEKGQLTAQHQQEKEQWKKEVQELKKARSQDLIDKLQQDLGINFLLDYQDIVDKLAGRTIEEVLKELDQLEQNWKYNYNQLETLTNQQAQAAQQKEQGLTKQITALTLLAEKRKEDLAREKQALIDLAQQKIKGKKEASELLTNLESKWKQEKTEWEQEKKDLINQHSQEIEFKEQINRNYEKKLAQQEQAFTNNRKLWQDNLKEKEQQLTKQEQTISQLKTTSDNLQRGITDLQNQNQELISQNKQIKQELQIKNKWGEANLPQLKEELFGQAQELFIQLKEQIKKATIAFGRSEIEKILGELYDCFVEKNESQRERERERTKVDDDKTVKE